MGPYTLPKTRRDPLLLVAVIKKRQRYCTDRGYQDKVEPTYEAETRGKMHGFGEIYCQSKQSEYCSRHRR
ncbi:hypothetical protein NC651_014304 [Populus alba x Populus x berolinensis]|nr:hypothetical protein NC651_014304 [Populus alba x Populus x berolinensis]